MLIDTAGRLQNKQGLMDELHKIIRVVKKVDPDAPHETLLVLDATVGRNALAQENIFGNQIGVSGIVMTKLDGTARGGVLVPVAQASDSPIKLIGVGEGIDDLQPFNARAFARSLVGLRSRVAMSACQARRWVRHFVDYAALAAFLITLVVTRERGYGDLGAGGGAGLALAVGLVVERRLAPMPLVDRRPGPVLRRPDADLPRRPLHQDQADRALRRLRRASCSRGLAPGQEPARTLMGDAFHLPDRWSYADLALRRLLPRPGGGQRGGLAHPEHGVLGLLQVPRHGDPDLPVLAEPGAADDEAHADAEEPPPADRPPRAVWRRLRIVCRQTDAKSVLASSRQAAREIPDGQGQVELRAGRRR